MLFASTSDLASHYGIPLSLPPVPSIQIRRIDTVTQPPSDTTASPEFSALKNNYLSMLSQKSTESSSSVDMHNPTVSPADLQRPVGSDFMEFEGLFQSIVENSNGSESLHTFDDFLTSPWTPSLSNMGDTPDDTPYDDFLTTPLIADSDAFPGDFQPLFDMPYVDVPVVGNASESAAKAPSLDDPHLITMSPSTPALDPATLVSPHQTDDSSFPLPHERDTSCAPSDDTSRSRRRTSATGTRKNISAESLVPLDAPTQPRRYLTASATSRKEMPAVFARKRVRQQMLDGEEDELAEEPLKPNATELEQIEWKRRQNTLAARKSRKRKLVHQQELENKVAALTQEKEMWRQRALMLQHLLQSHGVPFNEFQD